MTASRVSERIEAFSRPPVDSSPRPELDVLPEPDLLGHAGQRPRVDHGRAQLGQPALGQVGVSEVERLGDHDPEHRVAEELQALVGGQPTVLVGDTSGASGRGRAARVQRWDRRARRGARCGRSVDRVRSEDLATAGPGAVLAALTARAVRQVLGTAGRVGAGHQRRRDGLPLRATVARVAARHLPLRDSHCSLLRSVLVLLKRRQGGPARVDRRVVRVIRVVREPRTTLGAQPGTVVSAQRLERQLENHRVPQQGLEVEQVALEPADIVVGVLVGPSWPWSAYTNSSWNVATTSSVIGARHRAHSPSSPASAVPVTSTPSMTASSRRSRSTGDPSGTRRTSMPRSAGAGTVSDTSRWDPGRRPSSRVSSTSGALGSRLLRRSLPVCGHNRSMGIVAAGGRRRAKAGRGSGARSPVAGGRAARRAGPPAARAPTEERGGETSPPKAATSLTSEDARKEYSGAVGTKTVSRPGSRLAFIWAICSS